MADLNEKSSTSGKNIAVSTNEIGVVKPLASTFAEKMFVAKGLKEDGNALFKNQQYRKAITKYRTVFCYTNGFLREDSQMSMYQTSKADTLTDDEFRQVDELKKLVFCNISAAYFSLELFEKSALAAQKALDIDKEFTKALYRFGLAMMKLNKLDEARKSLVAARKRAPNDRKIYLAIEDWKLLYREAEKKRRSDERKTFGGIL